LSSRLTIALFLTTLALTILTTVECLNEEVQGSGKLVLKLHEDRLNAEPSLQSPEEDPELLLTIPFTEAVTVQSITIRNNSSRADTAAPRTVKIFARDDVDFEMARDMRADMELALLPPDHFVTGTIDYPCRPAGRFQNIAALTIFVVDNYDETGASGTEISYVGVKGKGTAMKRRAVESVYESQGMPKDHKVRGEYSQPAAFL
jgi:hypothetical protein